MSEPRNSQCLLYPRLPCHIAQPLAESRSNLPIEEALAVSNIEHPWAVFGSSGGNRVSPDQMRQLASDVRMVAATGGFPTVPRKDRDHTYRTFDAATALLVQDRMRLSASEAAVPDVWAFIGCILLPDVSRWRWAGSDGATHPSHFLGNQRGVRNTIGRLWWRAEIIGSKELLEYLNEDELVAVMERPGLAGNAVLARAICTQFMEITREQDAFPRMQLMRDATKRILRLLSLLSFEMMDEDGLKHEVHQAFMQSMLHLSTRHER